MSLIIRVPLGGAGHVCLMDPYLRHIYLFFIIIIIIACFKSNNFVYRNVPPFGPLYIYIHRMKTIN